MSSAFMLAIPACVQPTYAPLSPLFSRPHRRRAPPSSRSLRACVERPPGQGSSSSALLEPHLPDSRPARGYEDVLDCVLKVFCTHCEPNYELPWAMTSQRQSTSSAFVIQGRRILTNAHSVEHYTSVAVKKRYSDTKYPAKVVAIGNECDIAQLHVESEEFWEDLEDQVGMNDTKRAFLQPGPLPQLQDSVLVIGYPSPGNQISVTAGVSSRVEMQNYVHGQGDLLAVQIDAAINPGNSGGPVINENHEVVGIAFQSVDPSQADSVGYFIPYCVVQHFLDDIACHGQYTGFPFCGFRWQRMENHHLRRSLGMAKDQSGILVKWVAETCDANRVLQKGDIVTHVDGISVSNAGTVPFRSGERISLDFMVTSKFTSDSLGVTFYRNGKRRKGSYRLSGMGHHRLVKVHDAQHLFRRQPEYLLCGGLLFQVLSEPFLRTVYGQNWELEAPVRLIEEYHRGVCTKEGRSEVVVLAEILAARTTSGYEEEEGNDAAILKHLNGESVHSLVHLAHLIDACSDSMEFLRFTLDDDTLIVIDRKAAEEDEQDMLAMHCIPATRSIGKEQTKTSKP